MVKIIPNFNPNKWDREKILDYVIGDQPLTDEQLEFLNYFDKLQQENNASNEFEKWLLGGKMMFYQSSDGERLIRYGETCYKLKKLKEGNKKMNKNITLEDLGYELKCNLEDCIHYKKVGALGDIKEILIRTQPKDNRGLYINYSPENNGAYLSINELQAIYNKCKELGCCDED